MSRAVDYGALARRASRPEFVALHPHYFLLGRRQLVPARHRSTGNFAQLADDADPSATYVDEVVMREDDAAPLALVFALRPRHAAARAPAAGAAEPVLVTVGRTVASDVTLPDTLISRHHARFLIAPDRVELVDLRSANGTFVAGRALEAKKPRVVAPGELVRFAHLEFELCDAGRFWDRARAARDGNG